MILNSFAVLDASVSLLRFALGLVVIFLAALMRRSPEASNSVEERERRENRGYLLRVHCQDDEERAIRNAKEFMWMQGEFTGIGHPNWMSPAGYSSADQQLAAARAANRLEPRRQAQPFEAQRESLELIAGTPGQVIDELRVLLERTRPGILVLWGNDGKISHEDSLRCIELLGREVVPAVKEIGKELGLHDPFEIDAPVSLAETPRAELDPQPDYELPQAAAAAT